MKKLDPSEYASSKERTIPFGPEQRRQAAEAVRQTEIANPSVTRLLTDLKFAAEDSVNSLNAAFWKLAIRHKQIVDLESALQLANDEIIQLNHNRAIEPKTLALKIIQARAVVRAKADQLQSARDLEAEILASMAIQGARLGLSRWRRGLQQVIATFARDEIRKAGDCFVHITEEMPDDSVAKDPRVLELSRNSRLDRKAKSSFQRAAEAVDLFKKELHFLQDRHKTISQLVDGDFPVKFCSWEW